MQKDAIYFSRAQIFEQTLFAKGAVIRHGHMGTVLMDLGIYGNKKLKRSRHCMKWKLK